MVKWFQSRPASARTLTERPPCASAAGLNRTIDLRGFNSSLYQLSYNGVQCGLVCPHATAYCRRSLPGCREEPEPASREDYGNDPRTPHSVETASQATVACTGLEPVVSILRGWRDNQLLQHAMFCLQTPSSATDQ